MTGVEVRSGRERHIPAEQVLELYRLEDWWPERDLHDLAAVIRSGPCAAAWDDDIVVGFARAVTDGRFRAYVEDVVVHSDRRGSGLGRRLLEQLHTELGPVPVVSLFCSPGLVGTYESAGYSFTSQRVGHHRPG